MEVKGIFAVDFKSSRRSFSVDRQMDRPSNRSWGGPVTKRELIILILHILLNLPVVIVNVRNSHDSWEELGGRIKAK